ncbi:class I SAM-dependent methyltransferase [Kitasatospora sp. NPDC059827]|uniref:class I SAM-dependent methyltransferase n=1 Tax=Kitasatospora sp. NPDC059827 TaxID=3346964 RepID=UPI003652323D
MAGARGRAADRVHETEDGLQGDEIAVKYDEMQRHIRDHGWLQEKVDDVLGAGIRSGSVLELGCGPGYLGLEWMKQTESPGKLTGVDISEAMLRRARANAAGYGLAERCTYDCADVLTLPYQDDSFDHVFSSASLHEWADPVRALSELHRVLRPGGHYCVTDLRRDVDRVTFQFMKANIAADMRPGFRSSINSSYVRSEVEQLLRQSGLVAEVKEVLLGLVITGRKEAS